MLQGTQRLKILTNFSKRKACQVTRFDVKCWKICSPSTLPFMIANASLKINQTNDKHNKCL